MHRLFVSACLILALSACSSWEFPGVYHLDIDQGNIVNQDMVDQLELGMSRSQVEYIMGTPLVRDSFNPNRWDYVYRLREDGKTTERHALSAFFEGDTLVKIVTDIKPSTDSKMNRDTQPDSANEGQPTTP